jgi:hypothetical protein
VAGHGWRINVPSTLAARLVQPASARSVAGHGWRINDINRRILKALVDQDKTLAQMLARAKPV